MAHRTLTALELHEALDELAQSLAWRQLRLSGPNGRTGEEREAEWHSAAFTLSVVYGTSFEDTYKALKHRVGVEFDKLTENEPSVVGPIR